jgi:hypothetical protein
MIFTVESRGSEIWTIAKGTISNRGPFIQSLYQNDCVIITGNEGINFIPLLARFDADSKLLLKSVRVTFPAAPALRPVPSLNNVTFLFMAMPKDGGGVVLDAKSYTTNVDSGYWDWIEIPEFELPAIENAYWLVRSEYKLSPDFLNVSPQFIGATYKVRTGCLIETAKGPFYV